MFMDELDREDRVRNNLRLGLPRRIHDFHIAMRQICEDDPIDADPIGVCIDLAAISRPMREESTRRRVQRGPVTSGSGCE